MNNEMNQAFEKTKSLLLDLEYDISSENPSEGIIVIQKENQGIKNLIIGVAPPILIMEQFLFEIAKPTEMLFQSLLQKNRDIIHGAFVLEETGKKIIFRDTLQVENLDSNELEASINSLSLLLSEFSEQIIQFSKQ